MVSTEEYKLSLTPTQQTKLKEHLVQVEETENIEKLERVVGEAVKAGVRLNFSQEKFSDCIIRKIYELDGVKKNPKTASKIGVDWC